MGLGPDLMNSDVFFIVSLMKIMIPDTRAVCIGCRVHQSVYVCIHDSNSLWLFFSFSFSFSFSLLRILPIEEKGKEKEKGEYSRS